RSGRAKKATSTAKRRPYSRTRVTEKRRATTTVPGNGAQAPEKRRATTPAYAAQAPDAPLAPFQVQRRDVRPEDVQLEILYCGVCHSDIHMVRNEWKQTMYPVVPGHEIVGRVSAVGKKVTRFRNGDLAGVGVMVGSCRHCDNCRRGLEQYCTIGGMVGTYSARDRITGEITQGGYSKRIVVHGDFIFQL